MVCLGNICRSPMAAAVATEMVARAGLAERISVESFGTAGYHQGEAIYPGAQEALQRRGWPSDGHRARRITPTDMRGADLLLAADHANAADLRRLARSDEDRAKVRLLRSFDPASRPGDQEVPDPWGGDDRDFDHALDLIEAACGGLVAQLASGVH